MWRRRALYVGGAGIVTYVILFLAGGIALSSIFSGGLFGNSSIDSFGEYLIWFVTLPILATIAGSLPVLALGCSLRRALFSSLLGHISAALVIGYIIWPLWGEGNPNRDISLMIGLSATGTVLLALFGQENTRIEGLLVVLAVAAALIGLNIGLGLSQGAMCAWLILPMVIALFQRPAQRRFAD
jgi:hypothetical protein